MSDYACQHLPPRWREESFETFDLEVGKAVTVAHAGIRRLIEGEVASVLLSGPVGCGKSHLAAAACNEIASSMIAEASDAKAALETARDTYYTGGAGTYDDAQRRYASATRRLRDECPRWITVPELLGRLRREMKDDERPAMRDVESILDSSGLLVLDDLGSERATEWALETLFEVVSNRYDRMLPLLVTSNLTATRLDRAGYERIVSRLADGGALVEMASAADYRMTRRRKVAA